MYAQFVSIDSLCIPTSFYQQCSVITGHLCKLNVPYGKIFYGKLPYNVESHSVKVFHVISTYPLPFAERFIEKKNSWCEEEIAINKMKCLGQG